MARILIVDDEPNITQMISCALAPTGHAIDAVTGGRLAIDRLAQSPYDLVITDVRMPDADGFAVLEAAQARPDPPHVIIITGFGSISAAVDAMKRGAAEYITKPLDIPRLLDVVDTLLAERTAKNAAPAETTQHPHADFAELVGRSDAMQQLYRLIERVAPTPSTVLIHGASGSGKELVARAVHALSPRRSGPFIAVDCGSLPESLLESELFGHLKGSFTGAVADKTGLLEAAHGGSVLLDEIAELTAPVQQKLLRTLQERAVRPVGSTETRPIDVRILAATNRDLARLVADGTFRHDLYYRIHVVPIPVPPLADRRDDIPLLAAHFARKCARRLHRRTLDISDTVLALLTRADWPGNVRQLEHVIECAVTFAEGDEIRPEHLPPDFIESFALTRERLPAQALSPADPARPADITPLGAAIRYLERQMLAKALDASRGNKELAAQLLGIDRATLYRKLKSHNLAQEP